MIRRFESYAFLAHTSAAQRERLAEVLLAAGQHIPEVQQSAVGWNRSSASSQLVWEHIFDSTAAYQRYMVHPYHAELIDRYVLADSPERVVETVRGAGLFGYHCDRADWIDAPARLVVLVDVHTEAGPEAEALLWERLADATNAVPDGKPATARIGLGRNTLATSWFDGVTPLPGPQPRWSHVWEAGLPSLPEADVAAGLLEEPPVPRTVRCATWSCADRTPEKGRRPGMLVSLSPGEGRTGVHDIVIRGGRIADGTGSPLRSGDVAIDGDRIAAIGAVEERGRQEIDADGLLVTPGWVDVHTHYDGQVTWDPEVSPSGWHGVTTVVVGNCGVGFAPVRKDERDWVIQLMEGVEDIPGTALAEGMTWNWQSFPEYLDEVERMTRVLDVAAMVPHGALRAFVLGCDRSNAEAEDEELVLMSKLTAEALEAGAVGVSTTRTIAHMAKDGQPAAGTFAAPREMLAIGEALAGKGRRVFSVVTDHLLGSKGEEEFRWMAEVSKRSRVPVTYMVIDVPLTPGGWRHALERGLALNREGAWLVPQVAGKPASLMVGWESTNHLFSGHEHYQPLAGLPLKERVERLRNPEVRRAILDEPLSFTNMFVGILHSQLINGNLFQLGDPADYEPPREHSVAAMAAACGVPPHELAYDLMLERGGRELLYAPLLGYTAGDMHVMREMLAHPSTVLGLGDGGAHVGFICDGSLPTFMLTHWARDRHRGETLPLEHVVHLQTERTAQLFGFADRGRLAPGYLADVNVVDFDDLALGPVEFAYDLPANGKRLVQGASGYRATLKRGVVVREDDEFTGDRPGVLLRGPQAGPAEVALSG